MGKSTKVIGEGSQVFKSTPVVLGTGGTDLTTITAGVQQFAHGLGKEPSHVEVFLKKNAVASTSHPNYLEGDIVPMRGISSLATNLNFVAWANATDCGWAVNNNSNDDMSLRADQTAAVSGSGLIETDEWDIYIVAIV